jgi:hypothetical protein
LAINIIGTILFLGGEADLQQRARNSVASYAALAARVPLDPIDAKKCVGERVKSAPLCVK